MDSISSQLKETQKEKIILKSYKDSNANNIAPPDIDYINFNDISDDDIALLKPFLRAKQIDDAELTNDEVRLLEKLYTSNEIIEINSEKSGLNYRFTSLGSLAGLGLAIFFLSKSVGTIFLGAGSMIMFSIITAIVSLSKPDSTKSDRICAMVGLVGSIFTLFVVFKEFS